jgi:hypothetical protein
MSQHIFADGQVEMILGYDRPLDYVFCVVERQGREDDGVGMWVYGFVKGSKYAVEEKR